MTRSKWIVIGIVMIFGATALGLALDLGDQNGMPSPPQAKENLDGSHVLQGTDTLLLENASAVLVDFLPTESDSPLQISLYNRSENWSPFASGGMGYWSTLLLFVDGEQIEYRSTGPESTTGCDVFVDSTCPGMSVGRLPEMNLSFEIPPEDLARDVKILAVSNRADATVNLTSEEEIQYSNISFPETDITTLRFNQLDHGTAAGIRGFLSFQDGVPAHTVVRDVHVGVEAPNGTIGEMVIPEEGDWTCTPPTTASSCPQPQEGIIRFQSGSETSWEYDIEWGMFQSNESDSDTNILFFMYFTPSICIEPICSPETSPVSTESGFRAF